ncbi:hypothetical protein GCM10023189_32760 [Nibrella saemangeumensis]|uniref:Uncharacterized protein n=1 Tax=Nibrella saemangeumensis TaxID=1084526 RepID=A0ABP8N0P1_9BACT
MFEIYYGYWEDAGPPRRTGRHAWQDGRHFPAGWRFGCNIWFGHVTDCGSRNGCYHTVGLLPCHDPRGYLYHNQDHNIRASNPHYATKEECIEAAIRLVAARSDTTLRLYPDVAKYLLRSELEPFFALWQTIIEKEEWLNQVRTPKAVGLTEQLQLFY